MQLLAIENASVVRQGVTLFKNLSFSVQEHEIVHIKGINGSGKTTLMQSIAGLLALDSGKILKNDEIDIAYLGHREALNPQLSILDNIYLAMAIAGKRDNLLTIKMYLTLVNLQDLTYSKVHTLSRGQLKRLALVIVLLQEAKVWLLDEPFVNLDTVGNAWMLKIISWQVINGGAVILTTHQDLRLPTMLKHDIKTIVLSANRVEAECDA